jgi:hypothetical protein
MDVDVLVAGIPVTDFKAAQALARTLLRSARGRRRMRRSDVAGDGSRCAAHRPRHTPVSIKTVYQAVRNKAGCSSRCPTQPSSTRSWCRWSRATMSNIQADSDPRAKLRVYVGTTLSRRSMRPDSGSGPPWRRERPACGQGRVLDEKRAAGPDDRPATHLADGGHPCAGLSIGDTRHREDVSGS